MKMWCIPIVALTALVVGAPARGADEGKDKKDVPKLTVEEFDKKRKEKDTVVLDVRTPEEFKAGHVPGAVNLDIADENFDKKVEKLDKDKTYIVHCARGGRSARAAAKMKSNFANLYDFSGGMTAWQKAGKPVEKTPEK